MLAMVPEVNQRGTRGDAKSIVEMSEVVLDRGLTDVEPGPDLAISEARCDQFGDLDFASGEVIQRLARGPWRATARGVRHDRLSSLPRKSWWRSRNA